MANETITIAPGLAPAAPLMRLLSRFDRAKVEAFAEISIALLDLIDGDENLEDGSDAEQGSWGNNGHLGLAAHCMAWDHEDDEDDDPREIDEPDCEHDGREEEDGI